MTLIMLIVAVVIVAITLTILRVWFSHEVVWWELILPVLVVLVSAFCADKLVELGQTTCYEYVTGYITKAEYIEAWTERRVETTTDSKGRRSTRVVYIHHPAQWYADSSTGHKFPITSGKFNMLVSHFGNRQYEAVFRVSASVAGGMYYTKFGGEESKLIPATNQRSYENRIQCSNSVFKYQDIDANTQASNGLYSYPNISGDWVCPSILGGCSQSDQDLWNKTNAMNDTRLNIRFWILIYKNKPQDVSFLQEQMWKGGHQYDYVVTVGINNENKPQWARVFSWTKSDELKVETRNFIMDMPTLDLQKLNQWLLQKANESYRHRDFKEFSYIAVEPPLWAILVSAIVILVLNFGLCFWLVGNEYKESSYSSQRL